VDVRCGDVIWVEKIKGGVSEAMVDELHAKYKRGLVELFERYKAQYESTENATLVFVD